MILPRRMLVAALTALVVAAGAGPASAAEAPADLKATIDRVSPAQDGTFTVRGLIHIPPHDATMPLPVTTLTLRAWGNAPDGSPLTAVVTARLDPVYAQSFEPGYAVVQPFTASRLPLELHHQAPLLVEIDHPSYRLPVPAGQTSNAVADAVGLTARMVGDEIDVSYLRGTGPCTLPHVLVTAGSSTVQQAWTPRMSGTYCQGRIPAPQVAPGTKVGIQVPAPGVGPGALVTILAPRTVQVVREVTTTQEKVTVTSSPQARSTVLQRWTGFAWVTAETSTAPSATFTVPRTTTAVRYRVSIPQDASARSFTGGEFTVVAG
ncbi:hypothetical protein Cfla_2037 [Cellulomonas flavigena DSM 20109]|uniref:Uncharacterized protein n=1 Tax=Cellulomonas flavigena (strain ATCC 482 / DSM 20109 / BCRC 11376 / JCM 18109 / NBRC 3775 / NCIMB 8073 / NRS 134) TaxID=446466 RepID=D5UFD5_CELFN|nr:hypothetical protein [Cellulomonas flavigena]ADG74932.1 hypothetical protein Cfla_2037 [Cellulomonas flavigena DSM 20109]